MIIHKEFEETMEEIIQKFITKCGDERENLLFLNKGNEVGEELTFDEQANDIDKTRNKMNIIVVDLKDVGDLKNIKSDYFLQNLFDYLPKNKSLGIVKSNKKIQNRLNININDYKKYSEFFTPIEVEIIPKENEYGKFINIKKEEEFFYHIYFNDNKEEIKKNELNENDKISKIKIIIDYQVQ